MSRNRMMADVADADVVLVNPTHVAVALRYDPAKGAPRVVAKGGGEVAAKIRAIAEENRIPMVQDIPLARALHKAVRHRSGGAARALQRGRPGAGVRHVPQGARVCGRCPPRTSSVGATLTSAPWDRSHRRRDRWATDSCLRRWRRVLRHVRRRLGAAREMDNRLKP